MAGLKSSSDSSKTSPSVHTLFSGSSIPRYLTRVPKDQQKLLDNSDSWFSALRAGRKGGGNVPPKALEEIKYFHTAHTLPPPAQKPQPLVSSVPSPTAPSRSLNDEAEEGDNVSDSSKDPGTPISWSTSPKQPSPFAARPSSSSPSIKSQVDLESQVPAPSAPSGLPSSPPMSPLPSSPILKRSNPPARFPQPDFKRRRIGPFPSSSAGLDDDLETAIPGAVDQATPPINKVAARQATVSQALTTPPCGQGSMVPSTYDDARGTVIAPTQNKRRRYKAIKFSPDPAEDRPSNTDSCRMTTIPFSQPSEARPPQSSDSPRPPLLTASGNVLQTSQVVQETPSAARYCGESRRAYEARKIEQEPKHISVIGSKSEDATKPKVVINLVDELPASDTEGLSRDELRKQQLIRQLDGNWNAERSDWLPPGLRHLRSTLSCRSLETLYTLTKTAVVAGIKLERLWAEPDGCLYNTTNAIRSSGKLSFPEDLVHQSQDFFQAEISRRTKGQLMAPDLAAPVVSPLAPPTAGPAENQTSTTAKATEDVRPNSSTRPPSNETTKPSAGQPLEAFRDVYPSYRGSVGDFVKACLVVKRLHRKQALPKWLYDDFIRAFAEGYIPYVENKDTTDGRPLSAIQWYVENVEQPTFQKGVVTVGNLDLVFDKYAHEFKSAKQSLGGESSSLPSSANQQEEAQLKKAPEDVTVRQGTQVGLSPEVVQISKTAEADIPSEEAVAPSRTVAEGMPAKPKKTPTAQEKGKQRMSVGGSSDRPTTPASKPTVNPPPGAVSDDEDMNIVSSTTRPLSAPSKAGSVHTFKREEGHPSSHSPGQGVPRRALDKTGSALPQKGQVRSVAETPPARTEAPPGSSRSNATPRPAATPGRPRLDFGPPSFRPGSPAMNSLPVSTTDSRPKKAKADLTKEEWEKRWERKMKKKLEKKRLSGLGSTPQKAEDGVH